MLSSSSFSQMAPHFDLLKFCGPASTAGHDSIEVAHGRRVRVRPVIAVPAQFTNSQRKDTLVAAELAGLEDTRLVTEPAAALVAIAMGRVIPCPDGRYMIAGLGNGTFDCAVADIQTEKGDGGAKKIITLVATAGNNRLGGANLTDIVENMLINQLADKVESQVLEELRQSNDLRKTAESAKKHLRSEPPYRCTLVKQCVVIRGDEFLVQAKDVFDRNKEIVRKLREEPVVRGAKIRKCFLGGAASFTHGFRDVVADIASVDVLLSPDPKACVAEGAAYVSAGAAELAETLPRSIGIAAQTPELRLDIIPKRNSQYPAIGSQEYTTTQGQPVVSRDCHLRGRRFYAGTQCPLGYDIDGLTPLPKGQLTMKSMKVGKSGVLTVTAEEVRGSQQENAAHRELKVTETGNVTPRQRPKLEEQYHKFFGYGERPNQPLTKRPKI
ncbi:heat shock protein 70 family [Coniochaeta sp. 2T2.1]|nr:heat shock protein 70 family [Coniochaeta sp. 2T2.1]